MRDVKFDETKELSVEELKQLLPEYSKLGTSAAPVISATVRKVSEHPQDTRCIVTLEVFVA